MTAALDAYAAGRGGEHAVLVALDASRLLVPVVAVLAEEDTAAPGGPRRDKSSEMALPTVIGTDGRAAVPAFTSAATLARWRAEARPVPVPAARVWQSGARLAALAQGGPPPRPHEDPDVAALVHAALAAEPAVAAYRLLPGEDGTDLTLCLVAVPDGDPADAAFTRAARRASERVLAGAGPRLRRGIQVAVIAAARGGAGSAT